MGHALAAEPWVQLAAAILSARAANLSTDVLPGWNASAAESALLAVVAKCAANSYRSTTSFYRGSAVACSSCAAGMATLPGVLGATSSDACLTPPGYGWQASTRDAAVCTAQVRR